jgi:hypothetical protein
LGNEEDKNGDDGCRVDAVTGGVGSFGGDRELDRVGRNVLMSNKAYHTLITSAMILTFLSAAPQEL